MLGKFAVSVALAPLIALSLASPTNAESQIHYVALGDSYVAGAGVSPLTDLVCFRSSENYPSLVRRALGISDFQDVSCSGATQLELESQYPALNEATTLATVGIGGNDLNLLRVATNCLIPGCAERFAGLPRQADAFRANYIQVGSEIQRRAPHARTVFVGYPAPVPRGGCPASVPVTSADADFFGLVVHRLNVAMQSAAQELGATFVDLEPGSVAHTQCAPPAERWIEGYVPTNGFAPLHPNAAGQLFMAREVLASVQ